MHGGQPGYIVMPLPVCSVELRRFDITERRVYPVESPLYIVDGETIGPAEILSYYSRSGGEVSIHTGPLYLSHRTPVRPIYIPTKYKPTQMIYIVL